MDLVGNTGLHVEMVLWGCLLLDNIIVSLSPMNWLVSQIQWLMAALAQLLTMELFQLGGRGISLSLLVQMVTVVLVALLTARLIKRWIHARILARVISDLGSREAIATVLGYILSTSSVLLALQLIGINLSSLTVLLGTVGIGLGFALKTIASNFLSGIVLLFERPIKVGDFIEVDRLLGTVERITIRSTIVRTLDGVVVIVPNDRFLENNIINWSYQDRRCRVHVPVGIAYGSDPVLVTEALLAAARQEPRILHHPSPKVWLTGFSDNALDFELLVWIADPPDTDPIKSALYFLIEAELRRRQIEIPFPQRDLRIQATPALDQFMHQLQKLTLPHPPAQSPSSTLGMDISALPTGQMLPTLRDMLRRINYFEHCTDSELRQLIEDGFRQTVSAGEMIFQEDTPGDSFYIILAGSVEIFSHRTGVHIANRFVGDFFGEMSLLMGVPRLASVRALEETVLFVITQDNLQCVLKHHKELADDISQELVKRQDVLRQLGLLATAPTDEETPIVWIRRRMQAIFGI